jgi:hypothetical protein
MITITLNGFKTIEEAEDWAKAYWNSVEQDMGNYAEKIGGGYSFPFAAEGYSILENNIVIKLTHPDTYQR